MIINCSEDSMILSPGNGIWIELDLESIKEIIKEYNNYYEELIQLLILKTPLF